jgi:hypothetical protein
MLISNEEMSNNKSKPGLNKRRFLSVADSIALPTHHGKLYRDRCVKNNKILNPAFIYESSHGILKAG